MTEDSIKYSLTFRNKSSNSGHACVFQTDPDLGVSNVMSLAWFSKFAYPTTTLNFQWTIDYNFVWSDTGVLTPGVVFTASQSWPADLSNTNKVTLTCQDGAYTFQNQTKGPQSGILYIAEDSTIPLKQASVGIGMSGKGTFAVQAQPNLNLNFTPHPKYWIAFGNYIEGEVLDISSMTDAQEISFPANVYSMAATLNEDNSWTVEPTSSLNAKLIEARKRDPGKTFLTV